MNTITTIGEAIRMSLMGLWFDVVGVVPELISALVILIVGFIVAGVFGRLATRITKILKVDSLSESMGVTEQLKGMGLHFTFSAVIGKIVKIFFIIVFLNAAVDVLGMRQITEFLNEVLGYLPNVIVAVVIMAIGLLVGQFVKGVLTKVLAASPVHIKSPEMLGTIAMWGVIVFAGMAALVQMGIAAEMIQILFTAMVFALALAFGLGGKKHAEQALDAIVDSHK
jgi:hypothetical protein